MNSELTITKEQKKHIKDMKLCDMNRAEYLYYVERSIQKKYHKEIWCKFTRALREYQLLKPGDNVCVCISGGKDSMLMAKLFQMLVIQSDFEFGLKFLVMDPGYNSSNRKLIEENAYKLNIPIEIRETNIFNSVSDIEDSPCYLCARMRRGYLYSFAKEMGCNKIALGHHYDDVIETILMGMLYGAQVQTMMPKLHSQSFEGMELIRPLYLIREEDIIHWKNYNELNFLNCACKFTEMSEMNEHESMSKRKEIKNLIKELHKTNPFVEKHIFRSVENVNLNTIISYKKDDKNYNFLDNYEEQ